MKQFTVLSAAQQVAEFLKLEIQRGSFQDSMPAVCELVDELGVNHKTVTAAFGILEKEGLIQGQGRGLKRLIIKKKSQSHRKLRIAILCYTPIGKTEEMAIELYLRLESAGHVPFFTDRTLIDLDYKLSRVKRYVNRTEADAWIVISATREILEWFSTHSVPAFAIFGLRSGLPIAGSGPDKATPIREATRRLIELGHRRISMLCAKNLREPKRAVAIEAFLDELKSNGIASGQFNLPNWEQDRHDFYSCLDSLFKITPPTALILDGPYLFNACYHYLSQKGLRIPQDVSMVCTDYCPSFGWNSPEISHIRWHPKRLVQRVVRWTNAVAQGKEHKRETYVTADFIEGGTIGPVRPQKH